MPVSFLVEIGEIQVEVNSRSWCMKTPSIAISLNDAEKLRPEQIGFCVKLAIEEAQLAEVIDFSDYVVSNCKHDLGNCKQFVTEHPDEIATLRQNAGKDQMIDRALTLLDDFAAAETAKQIARQQKTSVRKAMRQNYNRLLVELGRRDGFACRKCNVATSDLQIDHILPVAKGGTNDAANLQLLCKACNIAKSDKVEVQA